MFHQTENKQKSLKIHNFQVTEGHIFSVILVFEHAKHRGQGGERKKGGGRKRKKERKRETEKKKERERNQRAIFPDVRSIEHQSSDKFWREKNP